MNNCHISRADYLVTTEGISVRLGFYTVQQIRKLKKVNKLIVNLVCLLYIALHKFNITLV